MMTFSIIGRKNGRPLIETRKQPASAAVLAMRWLAKGVEEVRIEQGGRAFELAAFQRRFLFTDPSLREGLLING